jgi:hypothetical protein
VKSKERETAIYAQVPRRADGRLLKVRLLLANRRLASMLATAALDVTWSCSLGNNPPPQEYPLHS